MDPGLNFESAGKPLAVVMGRDLKGEILFVDEHTGAKSLSLPPGSTFQPIPPPDPKSREICFVTGQSGSGKSYWTREYARMYKKIFPQRTIYLLSKLPNDETLDQLKGLKRIKLDTLVSDPISSIEVFKESLVILDDTETLGKEELAAVQKIRDDISSLGRHYCISMCVLQHLCTNGRETRLILGEAHRFVLFPHSMGTMQFRYILDRYLGLTKDEIGMLRRVPSRWICINKQFPAVVITENAARMLVTK